jgi:hypothetical protein
MVYISIFHFCRILSDLQHGDRMLIADADHDNKIVDNVLALQRRCRAGLADLEALLMAFDDFSPAARAEAADLQIRSLTEQLQNSRLALEQVMKNSIVLWLFSWIVLSCHSYD